MKFVFITDLHITSKSGVRTGDPLEDLCSKLQYVVDYCNKENATLLIGGDIFDKSIVPDSVKSKVASVLVQLNNKPIAIMGNHDRIYENDDMSYKTSYGVFSSHGVIRDISGGEVTIDGVTITNKPTIEPTIGRKCIAMYHGFLSVEDGRNTFTYDQVQTDEQVLVLLGHDHKLYKPLKHNNIVVHRPGSFLRIDRVEESNRPIYMVVVDQDLKTKYVPVPCREYNEVFEYKVHHEKKQEFSSYKELLYMLSNNNSSNEEDLVSVLRELGDLEVSEYVNEILNRRDKK